MVTNTNHTYLLHLPLVSNPTFLACSYLSMYMDEQQVQHRSTLIVHIACSCPCGSVSSLQNCTEQRNLQPKKNKEKGQRQEDRERADPCCWLLDHRVEFAYVLSTVK